MYWRANSERELQLRKLQWRCVSTIFGADITKYFEYNNAVKLIAEQCGDEDSSHYQGETCEELAVIHYCKKRFSKIRPWAISKK